MQEEHLQHLLASVAFCELGDSQHVTHVLGTALVAHDDEPLGRGSVGTVARLTLPLGKSTSKPCVVKSIALRDLSTLKRACIEAHVTRQLRHEAVPHYLACIVSEEAGSNGQGMNSGAGASGKQLLMHLIMQEWRPSAGNLLHTLRTSGPLPESRVRTIAAQLAHALHHLHTEHGLAYVDLKAENVLHCEQDDSVLLVDFDLCTPLVGSSPLYPQPLATAAPATQHPPPTRGSPAALRGPHTNKSATDPNNSNPPPASKSRRNSGTAQADPPSKTQAQGQQQGRTTTNTNTNTSSSGGKSKGKSPWAPSKGTLPVVAVTDGQLTPSRTAPTSAGPGITCSISNSPPSPPPVQPLPRHLWLRPSGLPAALPLPPPQHSVQQPPVVSASSGWPCTDGSWLSADPEVRQQAHDHAHLHPLEHERIETDGAFWGTLEYIAPEIIKGGSRNCSTASDWWALGVLVFELLFGRTPFQGPSQERTAYNITMRAPAFPEEVQVSQKCVEFIRSLLRHQVQYRLGAGGPNEVLQHPWLLGA